MKKLLISAAALAMAASSAHAAVLNGGFETNGGNGQVGFNTTIANWTVGGPPNYFFVFTPGAAPTSVGEFGAVTLYGPVPASPNGGAFVGADPGFQNATLSQTLTGLTPGSLYTVSFNWAGGQQMGFDGATNEGWQVSFGGAPSQSTNPLISNPNHGFTGWNTSSFNFSADGTSDTLTFLAIGTATQGAPPFALLDGVTVTPGVPEPATWAMMMVGFGALGVMLRRRRRELTVAA